MQTAKANHRGTAVADIALPIEDRPALAERFAAASPFPNIVLDDFLPPEMALAAARAYPDYNGARAIGREFRKKRENYKVGIFDPALFPPEVAAVNDIFASHDFLSFLEDLSGIDRLLADPDLVGGGMHLTRAGGRLDVHVDFNYRRDRQWHRRLNLLYYLNEEWPSEWGGQLELWNETVERCDRVVEPRFNRLVLFETSETSYHGVRPITTDARAARKSFAAYYYTEEAPHGWTGEAHPTQFRERPGEAGLLRRLVRALRP